MLCPNWFDLAKAADDEDIEPLLSQLQQWMHAFHLEEDWVLDVAIATIDQWHRDPGKESSPG